MKKNVEKKWFFISSAKDTLRYAWPGSIGLTENLCERGVALWFTEWVKIPETHTHPFPKGRQSTSDASGVAGVIAEMSDGNLLQSGFTSAYMPPIP